MMQNPILLCELEEAKHQIQKQISVVQEVQKYLKKIKAQKEKETESLITELRKSNNKKRTLSKAMDAASSEADAKSVPKAATEKQSLEIAEIQKRIDEINATIAPIERKYSEEVETLKIGFKKDISFSSDAMFFIYSDILSKVKKERIECKETGEKIGHDDLDSSMLKLIAPYLAAKDASEIVKVSQRALAFLSVAFVQAEAAKCQVLDKELLMKMVSMTKEVKHASHGAHLELPCFYYNRIIFQRALEQQIPIILKVRNFKGDPFKPDGFVNRTIFQVNPLKLNYEPVECAAINAHSLAIVMECRTRQPAQQVAKKSYIEEVIGKAGGIISLIEQLVAQHNQFTHQKIVKSSFEEYYDEIDMPIEEKKKVVKMGHDAISNGISPKNPFLCCPEHIYCNFVEFEMKQGWQL
jgi:hypothetical protein